MRSSKERGRCREVLVFSFAMVFLAVAGCSSSLPPQAQITWIDSVHLASKPADCSIPILHSEPFSDTYRRVAIVEAWGKSDQQSEVLDAVRQGACKIGADALLITSSHSQLDGRLEKMGTLPDSGSADDTTSSQVNSYKADLMPRVGQAGHPGYYIDAIAIVYPKASSQTHPSP